MEITTTTITRNPRRLAALQGLAVVGFITLIVLGIMLAIYSARFVPAAISRVGSAAVYLSQVFTPSNHDGLTVVQQVPFDANGVVSTSTATTSIAAATSTTVTSPLLNPTPATTAGPKTTTTVNGGGVSNAPLYGLPDLVVSVSQVGYLTNNSTDSFVGGSNVPNGDNAAVKFTVTNVGTNVTGQWIFNAVLPTSNSFIYTSNPQQSLRPGERIDFTLGFTQAQGGNRTMTITVDPNNQVVESSEVNNSAAASVTIQ